MEIIKDLGTNGGGFFNVNSAHPFENPNALHDAADHASRNSRLGAGLFYMFGKRVGDTRQGWVLWAGLRHHFCDWHWRLLIPAEQTGNPLVANAA